MFPANLILRKAVATDSISLLALVKACVEAMSAGGIEQWDALYPGEEIIRADIAARTLEVLTSAGGEIVACITVDQHFDPLWQNMTWDREGEPAAAVHRLMVHPSHQGQGIAKQLMRHAETVAHTRGCKSIRLDSFVQNPAASALYPKLGYKQTGFVMMRKGEFAGFEKLLSKLVLSSC